MDEYWVVIEPLSDADGRGYRATVPELPGCMSDGPTRAVAASNIADGPDVERQSEIGAWLTEARNLRRATPAPGMFMVCHAQIEPFAGTTGSRLQVREIPRQAAGMDDDPRTYEVFQLAEGELAIRMPRVLSEASVDDLASQFDLILRRLRRTADRSRKRND